MPPTSLIAAALFLSMFAFSTELRAVDRYVSPSGSNSNPGTLDFPYRNIDFAADRANPGDTIFVRGGTYNERVTPNRSGNFANRIAIRNFPDETPIIDGTGQSVGGQTAMVDIGNRSYITLDGFQIRNLTTSTNSSTPIGILVDGASIGIEILNCEIYDIRNNGNNGNAHGMLIQGTSSTPISALVVRGNEIRDLVLGNSEALVLNGNVDGFEVCENFVHDCNNLGIDFIGFEGNGPNGQDQARNGVCADNVVMNISTINNPAYNAYSAGGIYVDGGRDIIIERNRVSNCDIGIEIASEDPNGSTSNIIARNNILWNNNMGGFFVGGYNASRGSADSCTITNNTLYENDTLRRYSGEILVQYNTTNLEITNNLIMPNSQKDFIVVTNGNNSGITLDYNLYYSNSAPSPSDSEWIWNGDFRGSFSAWRSATGQDANSIYVNPGLSSPPGGDFTTGSDSPALNSGDPSTTTITAGEKDAYGSPRIEGNRIDIGAYESNFLPTAIQSWRLLHFQTASNTGDAANNADPDFDGLDNLLEFSLSGLDPTVSDRSPVAVPTDSPANLQFSRNPDAAAEINYRILTSSDLTNWSQIAIRPAGGNWSFEPSTTILTSGGNESFFDLRPGLGNRRYYKLEITFP